VLQVPRRVEYALRAVVALARASDAERVSFKDIAEREDIPKDYLAKILRSLVDARIVVSRRGANGGYALARPPHEISFLDVIEAADSPVAVNHCTENGAGCCLATECALVHVWQAAENAMRGVFARTTIASVITTRHPKPLSLQQLTGDVAALGCPDVRRSSATATA